MFFCFTALHVDLHLGPRPGSMRIWESLRRRFGCFFFQQTNGRAVFFFLQKNDVWLFLNAKISKKMQLSGSIWMNMDQKCLQLVYQISQRREQHVIRRRLLHPHWLPRSWILAKLFLASLKRILRQMGGNRDVVPWTGGMDVKQKKLPRFWWSLRLFQLPLVSIPHMRNQHFGGFRHSSPGVVGWIPQKLPIRLVCVFKHMKPTPTRRRWRPFQ